LIHILAQKTGLLKGQYLLFDDIRYFFYITNDDKKSVKQLIQILPQPAGHNREGPTAP
jgi:hypothetical protein